MELPKSERKISKSLMRRMLSAFPAGHYTLDAFFRLTDIVASNEVATAAIECRGAPRMLLNPVFVEKWCRTDEHLFMLVMHELMHVILGHTRQFKLKSPLDDIVFDAVINATESQMFRQEIYFSFFQNLYEPDKLPDAILRPPQAWPNQWIIPETLDNNVREIIRVLYAKTGCTYEELFDLFQDNSKLREALEQGATQECSSIPHGDKMHGDGQSNGNGMGDGEAEKNKGEEKTALLGDHASQDMVGRGEPVANHPVLSKAIEEMIKNWPLSDYFGKGRSIGGEIRGIILKEIKPPPSADILLKRLIKKMVESNKKGGTTRPLISHIDSRMETPLPALRDRRAFVSYALGWPPLIYRSITPKRKIDEETGVTNVYVDVSGSTSDYWEILSSLVRPYFRKKLIKLFVFSEIIEEVSPENLARGHFNTTCGTDANCIWKHVTENNLKKIIILTDGIVGRPTSYWQKKLKRSNIRIRVALTPDGTSEDLKGVCEQIIRLPLKGER